MSIPLSSIMARRLPTPAEPQAFRRPGVRDTRLRRSLSLVLGAYFSAWLLKSKLKVFPPSGLTSMVSWLFELYCSGTASFKGPVPPSPGGPGWAGPPPAG